MTDRPGDTIGEGEVIARFRQALDTAIIHKLETQAHGGLTEYGEGGLAVLRSLEHEFRHIIARTASSTREGL